jgi:hypothetical protein
MVTSEGKVVLSVNGEDEVCRPFLLLGQQWRDACAGPGYIYKLDAQLGGPLCDSTVLLFSKGASPNYF